MFSTSQAWPSIEPATTLTGARPRADPKDARVIIAEQLRLCWRSLPEVRLRDAAAQELRVLVGHRRDLVQEQQVRRLLLARLSGDSFRRCSRALRRRPSTSSPGGKAPCWWLPKGGTTPRHRVRSLGQARLARWLKARGGGVRKEAHDLAERVLEEAAQAHSAERAPRCSEVTQGDSGRAADRYRDTEGQRERLAALDARLEDLLTQDDPKGAIVMSLPGMSVVCSPPSFWLRRAIFASLGLPTSSPRTVPTSSLRQARRDQKE